MDGLDPANTVDLDLWGKSEGLARSYPLVCHLLDAGAMALVLWEQYLSSGLKRYIASALEMTESDAGRLIAFWAGLHDIGKAMSCFQVMDSSAFANLDGYPSVPGEKRRHEHAVHVWLGHQLGKLGYSARSIDATAFKVAQMLGGHHGRFRPRRQEECRFRATQVLKELGEGRWEEQRQALLGEVRRQVQPPPAPMRLPDEVAAVVCGLIILADWLVSQDTHLDRRLAEIPASVSDLNSHYRRSLAIAPALLRDAGLIPVRLRSGTFEDEFPHITSPNDLQRSIAENLPKLLNDGPGLLLITAPMGEGKTEAAFHGARLLGEASGSPGFFFSLPTMATSDQMYGRARQYGERQSQHDAALTLIHSMAWLNDAYAGHGTDSTILTEGASVAAPQWLHGRKRPLLASMAVGTVDQALLVALPLKHMPLRLLGLAGKVLIVDEVHAYDAFMQRLLCTTLTWLGRLGVPVVLMSATLPSNIAKRLISAYLRGSGHVESSLPPISYPGWAYADAASGHVHVFEVESRVRELRVDVRAVSSGVSGVDRTEALRSLLSPITTEGGCAAIVCNTVAEAQDTYLALRNWFDEVYPALELTLLHARFPARRREEITKAITARFGRCQECDERNMLKECPHRPRSAVVVATQVIEQSLDLDFDLMVSDLAPIALLLQRAGRCWRHAGRVRPTWAAEPRLVVLRPSDSSGGLAPPASWPFVYPRSLLRRTDEELFDGVIRIPDDVQTLVEKVYDESFANGEMDDDDLEWLGRQIAESDLAKMIAIPEPDDLGGLHQLTSSEVGEEMAATRLGADSVRVLCVYVDAQGDRYLDPALSDRLPDGKPNRAQVKKLLAETIPMRATQVRGGGPENMPPEEWSGNSWLRDLVILPLRTADDRRAVGRLGDRDFELHHDLGLRITG